MELFPEVCGVVKMLFFRQLKTCHSNYCGIKSKVM